MTEKTWREGYVPGKAKKTIHIDDEVAKALEIRAAEQRVSQSEIVEKALRKELGLVELTWQAIEDNGGGLHLAVLEGGDVIYYHHGYETHPEGLREDIQALCDGGHPIRDSWEGNAYDPQAAYDDLTSHEYGWRLVVDEDVIYRENMGDAALSVFGVTVNVVEVGESGQSHMEQVESFRVALIGTDQEVLEAAIRAVEDRGYTVVRNEDGGNCEVTRYSDGSVAVGITIERK